MAKKKQKKQKLSMQGRLLLIVFILTAMVFYKVSIVLLIGMLPTLAVRLVDRTPDRTKVLTVGFMNFAGCFPFCFQLFENKIDAASMMSVLANPINIIIMFAAAGLGYIIEWGVVGFVASLMVQKGRQRLIDIKRTQEAIVRKWGPEATGEIPLNAQGFAIEN